MQAIRRDAPQPTFAAPFPHGLPLDLVTAVRRHGAALPAATRAAVVGDCGRVLTWEQLVASATRVAAALSCRAGVGRGESAALLSRNCVQYAEAFLGVLFAGGCVVPLGTLAGSSALRLMCEDCGARALLVSREMRPLAEPFASGLAACQLRVGLDFGGKGGWVAMGALLAEARLAGAPLVEVHADDRFNVIYSSGTTGVPKGIVHTHLFRTKFCEALSAMGVGFDADRGDSALLSTPMYSNTTMCTFLPALYTGCRVIIQSKFGETQWVDLVARHSASHAMLVPAQYERLLRYLRASGRGGPEGDLRSLRLKMSTSAPLRLGVKRGVLEQFPGQMFEIYGLTEGGTSTTLALHDCVGPLAGKLASVGLPGLSCELTVIDAETLKEVPRGETGEIVGRSELMMRGYNNQEQKTRDSLWWDADGRLFFRSGDVGHIDPEGYVWLSDRIKDMIISGGLNIYATDLELVALQCKEVREVAVIAVPSSRFGESPLALVVQEDGPGGDAAEVEARILAFCNSRLGKAQRLVGVALVGELPKSPIGKVLKRDLRQQWKAWPARPKEGLRSKL